MITGLIITILLLIFSIYLVIIKSKKNKELITDLSRFDGIISIEEELDAKKPELQRLKNETNDLNTKYIEAKSLYNELKSDIKLYQNDLEFIELGVYFPIFNFETSEQYKEEITEVVDEQKSQIRYGDACVSNINWTVNNSLKKGEMMTRGILI